MFKKIWHQSVRIPMHKARNHINIGALISVNEKSTPGRVGGIVCLKSNQYPLYA